MKAVKINDIKNFMNALLVHDIFDNFLVNEASITTYNTFSIDGRINKNFYSDEELSMLKGREFSLWSDVKPFCFNLIKGAKAPSKMNITLGMSRPSIEAFIKKSNLMMASDTVSAMALNIRYENGSLSCITGISLTSFVMDKTLEHAWDDNISSFLSKHFEISNL